MIATKTLLLVLAALFVAAPIAPAAAAGFADPLATPAQMSPLATRGLMQAVTRAGDRLVAVGPRGQVVVSADAGATWKQSKVPVSSDLVAVYFADKDHGWAVGHDGVVLATTDAGDSWTLQLDGRKANALLLAAMERKAAAEPNSKEAGALLGEAKRYSEQGADKPFLDVWFADASNGYIVGAYNLIFKTADGGKTWEPLFDRTDNPKFFNLYAIRPAAGALFIAGEGGLVLKLDPTAQRFNALTLPYNGSFFGIADAQNSVIVFGLRGNVFRSEDGGRTWAKADTGLPATVVATTRTTQGATLIADVGGRVVATDDGGRTFRALTLKQPMPVTGLADAGQDRLAVTGPRGVATTETAAR